MAIIAALSVQYAMGGMNTSHPAASSLACNRARKPRFAETPPAMATRRMPVCSTAASTFVHQNVQNGALNARSNVILTGIDKCGITLYVLLQELPDLGFQPTEAHIQTGHFRFGKCEGRAIAFSGHAIQHRPSRVR